MERPLQCMIFRQVRIARGHRRIPRIARNGARAGLTTLSAIRPGRFRVQLEQVVSVLESCQSQASLPKERLPGLPDGQSVMANRAADLTVERV
jgi:hypothetical protein